MPVSVRGYAAQSSKSPVGPFSFTRRDLRPDDVDIDILYCGVCHTDIHQTRDEWHGSVYPVVPGHEIIGRVRAVGPNVTVYKAGDLVGVGCMVDSCRSCAACKDGLEQYCEEGATWTYNDIDRHDKSPTYGGYSERVVVSDRFVVRVPATLDVKSAAPLLCAGITTYSPLRFWNVGSRSDIAVVGLGGLGHMGVKFAKAFGAHVSLFTRSKNKTEEAKRLGVDEVILSTDETQMEKMKGRYDFILDTVPSGHDLNPYLTTLRRDGDYVLVGQLEPIVPTVDSTQLVTGRKKIAGSVIGGIPETQEMLDFCGKHGIGCDVEMIAMREINRAYERMLKSDVRYRFVIDIATMAEG